MSGRAKHRGSDRSSSRHKKKKSQRHYSSASNDRVIATAHRNVRSKDKRRKSEKSKRRKSSLNSSSSSDSSVDRLKLRESSGQLLAERPEFRRNEASLAGNSSEAKYSSQGTQKSGSLDRRQGRTRSKERAINAQLQERFATPERRVLYTAMNEKRRGGRRNTNESSIVTKKAKKSHKIGRTSRSSSSSSTGSSRSSSSSSSISSGSSGTSSSSSGYERRRKRKKRKKKLAKKMKREEKRRREEKRKIKKTKEKFKEPIEEIKRGITKTEQDRLLKDINAELADRARAMAPMTKEQWEKKQSVVRRVYDEETGRHRLIKGDGEVLEEIVGRDRHMEINRKATKGDGEYFQTRLGVNK